MSCEATRERLREAVLDRMEPGEADRAHAGSCGPCGAHLRFLGNLVTGLAPDTATAPATLARSRQRAVRVLRSRRTVRGIGGDLLRVLGVALLPLPFTVAHALGVLWVLRMLLGEILPEPVLVWLGAVYLGSLALGMGAVYGSLPFVVAARRRALEGA